MVTRSFARQSSHPSTRRLSLSLSLSLSLVSRALVSRVSHLSHKPRARARPHHLPPQLHDGYSHARAFVTVSHASLAHRSFVPSSLIPLTARRHRATPTSRAFHAPLATPSASTSRDANVSIASTTPSPSSSSTIPSSILLVVVDPRRAADADADATRCVVDRTRSIDVDRCRSDSIDPIERRSMSIQTRSIGLDRTRSDSIDRTRSIGLDRSDAIGLDRSDSIGRDRTRSDAIGRCGGRWSSMSRDRSSARLGVCATDPRPRVPRRARAFVRQSETRETRDRATEAARKCVRS